jgi:hypothetical protein
MSFRPSPRLLDIADVEWVDPPLRAEFVGVTPPHMLRTRRMLRGRHRFYFETEDEPASWWLGTAGDRGVVQTWGKHRPFEEAIHNR